MITKDKIIVALDGMSFSEACAMAAQCSSRVWGFKVEGLLSAPEGAYQVIKSLKEYGRVFADAKTHRIPRMAAEEVGRLASYGADIVSVHASGGDEMLTACVNAYKARTPRERPGLGVVAICLLTSIEGDEAYRTYGKFTELGCFEHFVPRAERAKAYGFVLSGQELKPLKGKFAKLKRITAGHRLPGEPHDDQKRVTTPAEAHTAGADLIVIGHSITQAENPVTKLDEIEESFAAESIPA